jgi:hypothetical protein
MERALMNRKLVETNPTAIESTVTTRVEKKQVEERVAIGGHTSESGFYRLFRDYLQSFDLVSKKQL